MWGQSSWHAKMSRVISVSCRAGALACTSGSDRSTSVCCMAQRHTDHSTKDRDMELQMLALFLEPNAPLGSGLELGWNCSRSCVFVLIQGYGRISFCPSSDPVNFATVPCHTAYHRFTPVRSDFPGRSYTILIPVKSSLHQHGLRWRPINTVVWGSQPNLWR